MYLGDDRDLCPDMALMSYIIVVSVICICNAAEVSCICGGVCGILQVLLVLIHSAE